MNYSNQRWEKSVCVLDCETRQLFQKQHLEGLLTELMIPLNGSMCFYHLTEAMIKCCKCGWHHSIITVGFIEEAIKRRLKIHPTQTYTMTGYRLQSVLLIHYTESLPCLCLPVKGIWGPYCHRVQIDLWWPKTECTLVRWECIHSNVPIYGTEVSLPEHKLPCMPKEQQIPL